MISYYLIEEYRRHASIAKKYSLVVFPIYVIFFVALGASFINDIFSIFPYKQFIVLTMISTFIYGFGVSSFEFLGRSKERASLNNITSTLPISQKRNYFYLFLRDTIYYTVLFIIPTYIGLLISIPFSGLSFIQITNFILALITSMFLGYSLGYLTFPIWYRSRTGYYFTLATILLYLALVTLSIIPFLPALFQIEKNYIYLLITIFSIGILVSLAYILTPHELIERTKQRKIALVKYHKLFKDILLAKEMEDVIRGGILIKSIFTYFFPMLLLTVFIKIINISLGKEVYNPMSLSIMLSIFSAVVYSWLTVLEDFNYLSVLPLKASDLVIAHIKSYFIIISAISIPMILLFNINSPYLIPQSLGLFYLNSIYLLSITAYIAGPKITSLLFNPGIIIRFTTYSIIPGIILMIGTFEKSTYSLTLIIGTAIFMIAISVYNFIRIKKKWIYF